MKTLGWTEKWTLRFAVFALLFLALSGFEGMLMRSQQYDINSLHSMEQLINQIRPGGTEPTTEQLYYGMLSIHPIEVFTVLSTWRSSVPSTTWCLPW